MKMTAIQMKNHKYELAILLIILTAFALTAFVSPGTVLAQNEETQLNNSRITSSFCCFGLFSTN